MQQPYARAVQESTPALRITPAKTLWCAETVRRPSLRITPAKTLWCAETVCHPGPFENNPSKACVLKLQFGLLARRRRPGAAVGCGAALRAAVLEGTMSMVMFALPVKAAPGLAVAAAAVAAVAAAVAAVAAAAAAVAAAAAAATATELHLHPCVPLGRGGAQQPFEAFEAR